MSCAVGAEVGARRRSAVSAAGAPACRTSRRSPAARRSAAGSDLFSVKPSPSRQRRHFVGADAIDQAVEVVAEPRLGAGAVRRFAAGSIDGRSNSRRACSRWPVGQLALAGVEVRVRTSAMRSATGSGAGRAAAAGAACTEAVRRRRHRRLSRTAAAAGAADENAGCRSQRTRDARAIRRLASDRATAGTHPRIDGRRYTRVRTTVNLLRPSRHNNSGSIGSFAGRAAPVPGSSGLHVEEPRAPRRHRGRPA